MGKPVRFLDLTKQYQSIKREINREVLAVLKTADFIAGAPVTAFESEFSEFVGSKHCVGVGNGTDALELAIEALDLPPGSEILVPANSFVATAEAVTRTGHRVKFVDVDPNTYLMDFESAEASVSRSTSALIVVHLYGRPAPWDKVKKFARKNSLRVIEDCAQSHGAKFANKHVGSSGDLGAFSFYPGKNLGAYGDAGAVVTNDDDLARRVRMLANHGRTDKYNHLLVGRNSRLDSIQAAVLRVKLRHLQSWVNARRRFALSYLDQLAGVGDLILPIEEEGTLSSYHLFVVRTKNRDGLRQFLAEREIGTGIHYPISLPKLAAYHHAGQADAAPIADKLSQEILSLPIGEHLTNESVSRVSTSVKDFFRG